MKQMTMTDVFERLVALAGSTNGGCRGGIVLACDLLHQDALYRLQEELATLLADVANHTGPDAQQVLLGRFPFLFQRHAVVIGPNKKS